MQVKNNAQIVSQQTKTVMPKRVVLDLPPYGRPEEGRRDFVRLDFCENTEGYPNSYPDGMPADWTSAYPEYADFKRRLTAFYGVSENTLLLTNGSDDGISVICNTYIEPGEDTAIISTPCFSMFPHCLLLAGANLRAVKVLPNLDFNLEGIDQALNEGAKLAIFATPENPTGAQIPQYKVEEWCSMYPETLIVIDEAYAEFAQTTFVNLVSTYSNLVVTKTFSKAWGMAGLRLGCVFAQPQLIDYFGRVALPYGVNASAVWTANKLLDQPDAVQAYVESISARKAELVKELEKRQFQVRDGAGNSVLLSMGINADKFCEFARKKNVLLRNRSASVFPLGDSDPMWGRVRVSVGTESEQSAFLDALDSFCASYGVIFDLDGTLVDTSESFDQTVALMVEKHSGKPLVEKELQRLREEGGYNDDWVSIVELLRRRGVSTSVQEIAPEALALYLTLAMQTETLLWTFQALKKLGERYPIFIVTGRSRFEYAKVWGDRLDPVFKRVYCSDDVPGCALKPSPDYILRNMVDFDLAQGIYIGNSVDDMMAGRDAGIDRIGITTSASEAALKEAGGQMIIQEMSQLEKVFQL